MLLCSCRTVKSTESILQTFIFLYIKAEMDVSLISVLPITNND